MIGDQLATALPELQAEAESLMVTDCRVRRPSGVTADPGTGADIVTFKPGAVFTGGCKIQTLQAQVQVVESGRATAAAQSYEVHLPVTSGPYRTGDVVEVLDAPGGAVVRRFRVEGLNTKTWQTAQRLPVQETL